MSDNLDLSASITTEEPEVAANLDELRFFVFQGKKGDTGDSAYDLAVALGFVGTEAEWIASLKGEKGDTGFSPEITSSAIPGGHRIDITNELGPDSFNVMDGEDGADGVSPTVAVTDIAGGHRVTITDADGAHTFDVMDGEGGSSGGAVDSVNGKTGVVVLDASDVGALPDDTVIPAAVTEQDVAGWGFTKNTGDYTKPSTGIPKSDLAQAVQTSLGKADTAVQPSAISDMATQTWVDNQDFRTAPFEIPITQSGSTYTTTATAEQIRAAKENSIFVFDGEARIKALIWLPWDEDLDMLIGMQMLSGTIMAVVATVTTNVAITVKQFAIPTDTSDLTNGAGYITMNDVPAAVTEQTVSGWGFTKNTGTYSKPSGGIPKTDLASDVQTSLGKADSALQQHQSLSDYQTKAITDTGNYYTTDTVDGALQEIGAELSGINTLIGSGVIS